MPSAEIKTFERTCSKKCWIITVTFPAPNEPEFYIIDPENLPEKFRTHLLLNKGTRFSDTLNSIQLGELVDTDNYDYNEELLHLARIYHKNANVCIDKIISFYIN